MLETVCYNYNNAMIQLIFFSCLCFVSITISKCSVHQYNAPAYLFSPIKSNKPRTDDKSLTYREMYYKSNKYCGNLNIVCYPIIGVKFDSSNKNGNRIREISIKKFIWFHL